jgi:hypothetical protein
MRKAGKLLLRGRLATATEATMKAEFAAGWSNEAAVAFDRVKNALTSAPTPVLPDFTRPFEVVCDANQTPAVTSSGRSSLAPSWSSPLHITRARFQVLS